MNFNMAVCVGIVLSLVYDLFQILMSWGNQLLFGIGIISFVIALYGLQQNLSVSDKIKIGWSKYYTIPTSIVLLGELSIIDDLYVKGGALVGVPIDRFLPGQTVDYLFSFQALLFSYALPLITLAIFLLIKLIITLVNILSSRHW
ncbi:hypothetical protein [Aliivibrio fischeri]|uniref:Uncharacterized protein n=1 Tax=Aliivibrio fischeri TaxID=668 RepID=A0A844NXG3_ALIFS|nr:hypothetical protein [Aliivibrio fischeri]MUK48273.1 hypothetical protein [Aliivibrio fischeri]